MTGGQTLRLVLFDLWADRSRSALSLLTLTLLMMGYFILSGFAESVRMLGAQSGVRRNLIVVEHGVLDPMDSQIGADILTLLRSIPGVEQVSPCQFRHMRINDEVVQLRACPFADWQGLHDLRLVRGEWPGAHQVAISEGAAAATGWKVGEHLVIYGSTFTVSGIVRAGGTKFSTVWLALPDAEQLFGIHGIYQLVMVRSAQDVDGEMLRAALEEHPQLAGHFDVMYLDALFGRYTDVVRGLVGVSQVLALAAATLIILGSYQATRLSLEERSREVGILRVIGFSRGQLLALFSGRAGVLLTLAYAVGAALATALLAWAATRAPLQVQSIQLEVRLTLAALLIGYPLSMVCAGAGAWISARSMLRLPPGELLR